MPLRGDWCVLVRFDVRPLMLNSFLARLLWTGCLFLFFVAALFLFLLASSAGAGTLSWIDANLVGLMVLFFVVAEFMRRWARRVEARSPLARSLAALAEMESPEMKELLRTAEENRARWKKI